jgi:hypothetical protein
VTRGVVLGLAVCLAVPAAGFAQQDASSPAAQRRRGQINVMEGVLAAAVRIGAGQAVRDMQSSPGSVLLSGQARARGFILEGYGVFFDVEIPDLKPSAVWSMQMLERDRQNAAVALEMLRSLVESTPDGNLKKQGEIAVKRLELQVGPLPPARPGAAAQGAATQVNSRADARPDDDRPDAHYTRAVINACLDAMIDHGRMELQPNEWLTVALRSSAPPLAPELYEVMTLVLRIKGSDLADFLGGRITREEVRNKVEVREF